MKMLRLRSIWGKLSTKMKALVDKSCVDAARVVESQRWTLGLPHLNISVTRAEIRICAFVVRTIKIIRLERKFGQNR